MGLFGGDTTVLTTTRQSSTDRRTLAEAGGAAAQSIGRDLILESASEEAIAGVTQASRDALDLAKIASEQIAGVSGHALDIVAATRGTQPINPVWVILALGAAFWLAKGKLF